MPRRSDEMRDYQPISSCVTHRVERHARRECDGVLNAASTLGAVSYAMVNSYSLRCRRGPAAHLQ